MVQPRPEGIAQAFLVGKEFIGSACCALVLGDNIFYGHDLAKSVQEAASKDCWRAGIRLSGARSRTLRSGGIRLRRKGAEPGGETEEPKSRYAVTGTLFLRQPGGGHRESR